MKSFVLIPLLPIELVRNIQQFLAHDAVNTIIRAYYRKTIFKIKITEYFCSIRSHMFIYGYYKINTLPTFVNNLKLASRFINEVDDSFFWGSIYINIQKTLSYEETLWDRSIIYPASYSEINNLCNYLRLAIGAYLTYHY
jgi:hypothetical protein